MTNADCAYKTNDKSNNSEPHNHHKATGQCMGDKSPMTQHPYRERANRTATLCALRGGHLITLQPTHCVNGPRLGAQPEQGATGRKAKCGRW